MLNLEVSPSGGLVLKQGAIIIAEISQVDAFRLGAMLVAIAAGVMPAPKQQEQSTLKIEGNA